MERLKNLGLKKSFVLLTFLCLSISLVLVTAIWLLCSHIQAQLPSGGIAYSIGGSAVQLEAPTFGQKILSHVLSYIQILSCILFPVGSLIFSGALFYHLKCKAPIEILQRSVKRIENQDLDFSIPVVSNDELGQLCAAFETMRKELLISNQKIWRQTEERKRLNAAFSHDLRNPVTVLKGTIKLLRQNVNDEQTLDRLETYTLRIEQYVESMSGIQRLEQLPVQKKEICITTLKEELTDTVKLLAPFLSLSLTVCPEKYISLDHGLFLTVAENLIGNAARFAKHRLFIELEICSFAELKAFQTHLSCLPSEKMSFSKESFLILSITDDGPGYPKELIKKGPKPFEKTEENSSHFGMGLYSCRIICIKHGGALFLENKEGLGARAAAVFQI